MSLFRHPQKVWSCGNHIHKDHDEAERCWYYQYRNQWAKDDYERDCSFSFLKTKEDEQFRDKLIEMCRSIASAERV